MNFIKNLLAKMRENKRRTRLISIAAALVFLLLVCTCISIHMRANIQSDYASAAGHIREQIYSGMREMTETFSRIEDPNVDVQHKLIPSLKAQYSAVKALNESLASGFGKKQALLDDKLIAGFDAAFDSFAAAYRDGKPTGLAQADMLECIEDIAAMVEAHYPKEEELPELNPDA